MKAFLWDDYAGRADRGAGAGRGGRPLHRSAGDTRLQDLRRCREGRAEGEVVIYATNPGDVLYTFSVLLIDMR